jgi:hypothetical protein
VRIPPPPGDLPTSPDRDTRKAPDHTGAQAHQRVLFINLRFIKYGTDDRTRAAALFLCMALLVLVVMDVGAGQFGGNALLADKAFAWLGNAFLFLAGIAVGRGGQSGGGIDD